MLHEIKKYWKKKNYEAVYTYLKQKSYVYKLESFENDFKYAKESDLFSYFVYLLSKEPTTDNIIFGCEYLIYHPPFFDIYSVIGMFLRYSLNISKDIKLKEWIIATFQGNPDSPFSENELEQLKEGIKK